MIDLIKIFSLDVPIPELLENELLDFPVNAYETGELNDRNQTCDYKNIKVTLNKARNVRKLKGSIHKYFNGGTFNYDDFNFQNVVKSIVRLCAELQIDPARCILNNIEYAVNLLVDFDPTDLIKDLIHHDRIPFIPIPKGIGRTCTHSQSIIKIYNKGYQFGLPYNVLRIEIRVKTMGYLHDKGIPIWSLADLLIKENHELLAQDLLTRFNEILFYDGSIKTEDLSLSDQLILSKARIPDSWINLPDKYSRDRFRRQYNMIFKTNLNIDWQKVVIPMIQTKLGLLLSDRCRTNNSSILITENNSSGLIGKEKTPNETIEYISDSVPSYNYLVKPRDLITSKLSDSVSHPSFDSAFETEKCKLSDSVSESLDGKSPPLAAMQFVQSDIFIPQAGRGAKNL